VGAPAALRGGAGFDVSTARRRIEKINLPRWFRFYDCHARSLLGGVTSVTEALSLGEMFWPPDGSCAAVLPRREATGGQDTPHNHSIIESQVGKDL